MRAVAVLVLSVSCYRAATPPAPPVTPVTPAPSARIVASADPLAFLPTDADAVIAIDARAIKSSSVWKQLAPVIQPKLDMLLALFKGTCNFDPIAQVKQMSLAVRDPSGNYSGVWVVRGYEKKQVIACLEAAKKLDNRSITIDHDVVTIGTTAVVGFADDTTLVSVYGANATTTALAEAIDGGAPLRMAPGVPALLERIEHRQAWFIMFGTAKPLLASTALAAKPVAVTGALDVASDVDAQVRIRFAEPDQATAASALLQAQLPQLQGIISGVDVSTEDIDTVLQLHMSSGQLQMILGLIVP